MSPVSYIEPLFASFVPGPAEAGHYGIAPVGLSQGGVLDIGSERRESVHGESGAAGDWNRRDRQHELPALQFRGHLAHRLEIPLRVGHEVRGAELIVFAPAAQFET